MFQSYTDPHFILIMVKFLGVKKQIFVIFPYEYTVKHVCGHKKLSRREPSIFSFWAYLTTGYTWKLGIVINIAVIFELYSFQVYVKWSISVDPFRTVFAIGSLHLWLVPGVALCGVNVSVTHKSWFWCTKIYQTWLLFYATYHWYRCLCTTPQDCVFGINVLKHCDSGYGGDQLIYEQKLDQKLVGICCFLEHLVIQSWVNIAFYNKTLVSHY